MGRERGRPIFEPGGFCVPLLGAGLQPARSRAGRGGAHKTILRLSRSGAFRAFSPSANRCKCLRKHRTKLFKERLPLQASIALYTQSSCFQVEVKGPRAFFHFNWKGGGGGGESLREREVEEGCSGSAICAIDPSCRGRKTGWRVHGSGDAAPRVRLGQ